MAGAGLSFAGVVEVNRGAGGAREDAGVADAGLADAGVAEGGAGVAE